jgi:hypothetical protein
MAAASEERQNSQPNPQEDPKAKYQATSSKDFQQIPNQKLDLVEGSSTPPPNEKRETARMGGTGSRSTGLPSETECAMDESKE